MRIAVGVVLVGSFLVACSGKENKQSSPDEDTGVEDADDAIPTKGYELAKGLAITEIALFQAVKVPLMKDGAKVTARKAQPVVGREGVVRVYVKPEAGWEPKGVVAEMKLSSGSGDRRLTGAKTVAVASTEGGFESTINIDVPTGALEADTKFSVSLLVPPETPGSGGTDGAAYPATDKDTLDAGDTGELLKIVLVPVVYKADGSGRLPDTGDAQVDAYKQAIYAMYPLKNRPEITVHAPYAWSGAIQRNGTGWGELLNSIISLRQKDGVPDDVYYYGAFEPSGSFGGFCGGGCMTGLSSAALKPTDSWARASIGLGFPGAWNPDGSSAASTMQHEVGHAHGRLHSPCAPGGDLRLVAPTDPAYPYSDGKTDGFGFDVVARKLMPPTQGDIMSYCPPTWISDYTYNQLFKRVQLVNKVASVYRGSASLLRYRMVNVTVTGEGDLGLGWGEPLSLPFPPDGEPRDVKLVLGSGATVTVTGSYHPFDHLDGGLLLVPEDRPFRKLTVRAKGGAGASTLDAPIAR